MRVAGVCGGGPHHMGGEEEVRVERRARQGEGRPESFVPRKKPTSPLSPLLVPATPTSKPHTAHTTMARTPALLVAVLACLTVSLDRGGDRKSEKKRAPILVRAPLLAARSFQLPRTFAPHVPLT